MGGLVLHNSGLCGSSWAQAWVGGAAKRRHQLRAGKWEEAGDSQASKRGFGFSYLVPANSPCSEDREIGWGSG